MCVARLCNAFIYLFTAGVHNYGTKRQVIENLLIYYVECEVIHKAQPLFPTYRQRANQKIQQGFGGISM